MGSFTVFTNEQFGTVRGMLINGDPWFVAVDICNALGISNPSQAVARLHEDERATLCTNEPHSGKRGGAQYLNVVSEAGLYILVFTSRKPGAEAFMRWIAHDVLPAIRKTGGYVADADTFVDTYLHFADEDTRTLFKCVLETIHNQNQAIARMRPKEILADSVTEADSGILVGTFAKLLRQRGVRTGQNRFFAWLRDNGYLMKEGSWKNLPTQMSMELGLFNIRKSAVPDAEGKIHVHLTPLVTGKGQVYFLNLFLGGEQEPASA